MKKRLAIIGSGDLGQLIAYHAALTNQYTITGFFDDFQVRGSLIGEHMILGDVASVLHSFNTGLFDVLMIGIGYKHFRIRKALFEQFKNIIPFATVINPDSVISPACTIHEGAFILPGCTLDRNVIIMENVLINTGSVIAHDTIIKEHTFLAPAVAVAGFVEIGSCCNIGINSTIIDNITIADNIQTGGGTVVIKNLSEEGLYVGNPARFIDRKAK